MYKRLIIFFLALVVASQLGSVALAYTPDDIAAEALAAQAQPQQIAGWKILLNNITKIFGFEAFKTEFSGSYAARRGSWNSDSGQSWDDFVYCTQQNGHRVVDGMCTYPGQGGDTGGGGGGGAPAPNDPQIRVPGGGGRGPGAQDIDNDGYFLRNDCDDRDDQVNPGRPEIPGNGKDDDCNPDTPDDRPTASNDDPQNVVVIATPVATPAATPKTVTGKPTIDGAANPVAVRAVERSNTSPSLSIGEVGDGVRVSWSFGSGEAWPLDWIAVFDAQSGFPLDSGAWSRVGQRIWKYAHNGKDIRTTSVGASGSVVLQKPEGAADVIAVYYRDNGFTVLASAVLRGAPIRPQIVEPTAVVTALPTPSRVPVASVAPAEEFADCSLVEAKRASTRRLTSNMGFFERIRSAVSGSSASQLPEDNCPRITSVTPSATSRDGERIVIAGSGFTTKGNVVYFLQGRVEKARVAGSVSFNRTSLTVAVPTLVPGFYDVRVMNEAGKIGNAMQVNVLGGVVGPTMLPAASVAPLPSQIACAQVITPARNNETGVCREFATPCDVPTGWTVLQQGEQCTRTATPAPTVRPTVTPRPTPVPRVGCSPTTQTVRVGDPVTLTALGGSGRYTWRAPKSAVLAGDGQTFTTVYEKKGRYYVSVSDGARSRSCRVIVTQ